MHWTKGQGRNVQKLKRERDEVRKNINEARKGMKECNVEK
jgi:hypothetical protein